ncbi:MAG TPA: protein translocase subunit SecD [Gaiellaceae bacterium]|nr:protein translocase subunit SecD [Gaiellaceae bacterium]
MGVAALAVPASPVHRKATLGLDLQGGLEVVLQAVPPKGHQLTSSDLDRSVSIMRDRVDKLGVSEPEIRKQGSNQIVIELAGVHDPQKAAQIIGKTAQLELYDLETSVTGPSKGALGAVNAKTKLYDLLKPVQAKAKQGTPETYYLFHGKQLEAGPIASRDKIEQILAKKKSGATTPKKATPKKQAAPAKKAAPEKWEIMALPEHTAVITCSAATSQVCPGLGGYPAAGQTYWYLFEHDLTAKDPVPQMTGGMLDLDGTRADIDPQSGSPVVLMKFKGEGNKAFRDITAAEARRGSAVGTQQHFAIVLDNQIRSWPQIDYTQYPNGIDPTGGGAQITGLQSQQEAKDIALVLQTGALPVKFSTIERSDVSATLGKDSLSQAYKAAIGGLILVALFLLLVYRFLGLVAVIGLGVYAAFLYAAILLFNVTMTLPGFAGIVLTIGVAADANIVIFERIKEEFRAGKSVRAAVNAGYAKGFHTIVDANVVTAITALVLFAVATAGVKGFALMLLIGTVISLITAVAATRAMLGLLAGFRWFDNPRFMGASGPQHGKWLQIDFARRWKLWFAISGVFLVIAAGSLGVRGLNLGIDFEGGTQITFATPKPTPLADVRAQAARIGQSDAQIQGREQRFGDDSYKEFQVRTRHLEPSQQNALQNDLKRAVDAQKFGIKSVSSSFGSQIARLAIIAILVSLVLIVLYIWARFDFKFGIPVIVGMLHDVLITIGIYSLTGREVTASTVAAILTVLGYSIYDNIIIFDRVRENIPLMRRAPFARIANVSLWETIRRSLATTLITLLPVGSLLFFGGDTLKDFAFALLIGIASGAYSSIFIATPLLSLWKEREPEYARRSDHEGHADGSVGGAVLQEMQTAAAREPVPAAIADPVGTAGEAISRSQEKRERRKQRRRSRPHGRAR